LLELCVGGVIDKRRHLVRHHGHLWEVDEFLGDNAGLVVAEIELGSAGEAFMKPEWLGREATDAPRYYNLALASRPFCHWSQAERDASDLPAYGLSMLVIGIAGKELTAQERDWLRNDACAGVILFKRNFASRA